MIKTGDTIEASSMVTLARYGVDSVGTDSYAITSHSPITAYASGQKFRFKAGSANASACSLNVDGLGAKTIKKNVSDDLVTGDILANQIVEVVYDGINMQLVSIAPTAQNSLLAYPMEDISGASTPQAVFLNTLGKLRISDADDANRLKFSGFVKSDITAPLSSFINGVAGSGTTISNFVAQAGNKRVAIVMIHLFTSSGTPTNPTGVTYGGVAMTQINAVSRTQHGLSIWYKVLGDNASSDSAVNIITSGQSGTGLNIYTGVAVYNNTNQTTPYLQQATGNGSAIAMSVTLDPTNEHSKIVYICGFQAGGFSSYSSGQTERVNINSGFAKIADVLNEWGASTVYTANSSSSGNYVTSAVELNTDTTTLATAELQFNGIVGGFSGLTIGSYYYVSNTAGAIGTSAGGTSIRVGRAISATQLLITD